MIRTSTPEGLARAGAQRWFFDVWSRFYDLPPVQWATYWPVHDAILAELRRQPLRRILDVGCGTGIFADQADRELAPGGVAGCDLSAGMLAQAAARSRRVGWVRGDSARLPFRPGAFDAVVCTQAFHFFDQPQAWREFQALRDSTLKTARA